MAANLVNLKGEVVRG